VEVNIVGNTINYLKKQ